MAKRATLFGVVLMNNLSLPAWEKQWHGKDCGHSGMEVSPTWVGKFLLFFRLFILGGAGQLGSHTTGRENGAGGGTPLAESPDSSTNIPPSIPGSVLSLRTLYPYNSVAVSNWIYREGSQRKIVIVGQINQSVLFNRFILIHTRDFILWFEIKSLFHIYNLMVVFVIKDIKHIVNWSLNCLLNLFLIS